MAGQRITLLIVLAMMISTFTIATTDCAILGCEPSQDEPARALQTGSAPYFVREPNNPLYANYDSNLSVFAVVRDLDNDALTVTWDWGDGNVSVTYTAPAYNNTSIRNYHYYRTPGWKTNVTLTIYLDDGNGNNVSDTTTVVVTNDNNMPPAIVDLYLPYVRVNPSVELLIVASANDTEGDALTWTFRFEMSGEVEPLVVNHTNRSAPGELVWGNITHVFDQVGRYNITLNISDVDSPYYQIWPHNISQTITVDVVENVPPEGGQTISISPSDPVVTSELGYVVVRYSISARDLDGDVITATWDFDDGTDPVVNASTGGSTSLYTFRQYKNYTDAGVFNVSVTISDGYPGHEYTVWRVVVINSTNRPPDLVGMAYTLSGGGFAYPNETIQIRLNFSDPEGDTIQVIVDFGDNSSREYYNLTGTPGGNVTLYLNHSYARLGTYLVSIWFTDNKIGIFEHNRVANISISVRVPEVVIKESWSWWDYTSLGLVLMIPVLLALRMIVIYRQRKALEQRGYTLEEWKLIQSEMGKDKQD